MFIFFLMIRRPPRSTLDRSSAASDVYKRQVCWHQEGWWGKWWGQQWWLSLIHISEPTRLLSISYAVFCLKKKKKIYFFFIMIRRPPRSTLDRSSAASDVYKRQVCWHQEGWWGKWWGQQWWLSLIHISEPTRLLSISYAVFCLKKKKKKKSR